MKKIAMFAIIAVILLSLCSCGQKSENANLLITNESSTEIASIGIHVNNQSHGVRNADNSPLKKGEVLGFHMDEQQACVFRVELHDMAGNTISLGNFTKDFIDNKDKKIYLYIKDDGRGNTYITDEAEALFADSTYADNTFPDNIIETIERNLDIITSSPAFSSNSGDYIDAHKTEYDEIVALGNNALQYMISRFDEGGQTGLRGHIMAAACRDILGMNFEYDAAIDTGQKWYDENKELIITLVDKNI